MIPVGKLAQIPGHILQGCKIEMHEVQHYGMGEVMGLAPGVEN